MDSTLENTILFKLVFIGLGLHFVAIFAVYSLARKRQSQHKPVNRILLFRIADEQGYRAVSLLGLTVLPFMLAEIMMQTINPWRQWVVVMGLIMFGISVVFQIRSLVVAVRGALGKDMEPNNSS